METNNERFFSVELKAKSDLKNVTLTNGSLEVVLIEGCIGDPINPFFTYAWRYVLNITYRKEHFEEKKMPKALIVYGTRTGSTANTSEVIADTLQKEGLTVKVVNAKKEKIKDISEYDLVVVGSGVQIGKWTGELDDFLKKHQNELASKKLALFVCCGSANPLSEGEQRTKEMDTGRQKYLEDKAAQYNLKPVAMGYFGGCYNFNRMSWFFKKTLGSLKPKLEAAGYKPTEDGVYDLRDLNAVRAWAKELAKQ